MTIGTTYDKIVDYAGNGSTTVFSTDNGSKAFLAFNVTASTHSLTVKTKVVATGVETTLTENSDYTVALTGTAPSLANVTLSVAPASGTNVYLISNIAFTQGTNFNATGSLDLDSITAMADKLTLLVQQLNAGQSDLAVQLSETSGLSGITLPAGVADGIWKWNTAIDAVEFVTIGSLVSAAAFDISALTASTAMLGTDHIPFYDVSLATQVKGTITDLVEAGILGLSSISEIDSDNDLVPVKDATDGTMKFAPANLFGGSTPDGSIKAIDAVTITTDQTISGTADVYANITGLTLDVTPTSADSRFLISYTVNASNTSGMYFTDIFADGVSISKGEVRYGTYKPNLKAGGTAAYTQTSGQVTVFEIYEPGSIGTFTLQVKAAPQFTGNLFIGRDYTDTDSDTYTRSICHLNYIEIL